MRKLLPIAVTAVLTLGACGDFLEVEPTDTVGADFFYENANQAELAIGGLYDAYQDLYEHNHWIRITELPTDNMDRADGTDDLDDYSFEASDDVFAEVWRDLYGVVLQANAYLQRAEGMEAPEETKRRLEAEVRALRGYAYFTLARLFGGVPILDEPVVGTEARQVGRSTREEVYDFALQDLAFAAEHLTYERAGSGRISLGPVQMATGELYLWREQHCEAAAAFKEVIDAGPYMMEPEVGRWYENVWQVDNDSPEALWVVKYQHGTEDAAEFPTKLPGRNPFTAFARANNLSDSQSSGDAEPTDEIGQAFDRSSVRFENTILASIVDDAGFEHTDPIVLKFMHDLFARHDTGLDWIVYRLPDLYTLYAEAAAECGSVPYDGEAREYVNMIRRRAYGLPLDQPSPEHDIPAGLGPEAFLEEVWHERRLELAFEGKRWFDLVRRGTLIEEVRAWLTASPEYGADDLANVRDCMTIFPIPQREIDVVPDGVLTQNECYQ